MIAVIGSSNVDITINVDDFTLRGQTQKGWSSLISRGQGC
ncbi:conserved hypothetical protein [Mesotoga infera]|nr:conserved hypothetical protein [Mesotoga infera]